MKQHINKIALSIFFPFLFLSIHCTNGIDGNKLECINGKYHEHGSSEPFSGKALYWFPSGVISAESTFEKGYLRTWTAFDFRGDTVNMGNRILIISDFEKDSTVKIIQVEEIVEAPLSWILVEIILKQNSGNDIHYEDLVEKVISELYKNEIFSKKVSSIKSDNKIVIEVSKCQLGPPLFEAKR